MLEFDPVPEAGDGLAGMVCKNVVALAHRQGFEFVARKARGATMPRRGLSRPGPGRLAATVRSPDPARFFSVSLRARPGINHLRFALELLVREAVALGRTPVAFKPSFDPRHNLGHDLDVDWDRYIDLDRVELVDRQGGAVTTVSLRAGRQLDLQPLSVLWVERQHVFTAVEQQQHDLLVRHNRTGLQVPAVHEGPAGLPNHAVRFHPSRQVLALAAEVRAQLGEFVGVHVRRDDMLEMTDQYPNLDRQTQPDHIAQVLSGIAGDGATVYILTNERDQRFFQPLKPRFRLFQYFDFPPLQALVDGPRPDNFLLFEVEKQLFDSAALKVHTFTHPEGGQRIALCSDKGWA